MDLGSLAAKSISEVGTKLIEKVADVNAGLVLVIFAGSCFTLSPASRSWGPPGCGVGVGLCSCGVVGGTSRL